MRPILIAITILIIASPCASATPVHFEIAEPEISGKLTLFPVHKSIVNRLDENGVYETVVDGLPSRHIATITSQASGLNASDLDTDVALQNYPGKSVEREAPLKWLRDIDAGFSPYQSTRLTR
jgi:hypothetical protein